MVYSIVNVIASQSKVEEPPDREVFATSDIDVGSVM